jgi:hypothetical protein
MPKQTGQKTKTSSRKNARKGDESTIRVTLTPRGRTVQNVPRRAESTIKVTLTPHGRIVSRHPTTTRRTVDAVQIRQARKGTILSNRPLPVRNKRDVRDRSAPLTPARREALLAPANLPALKTIYERFYPGGRRIEGRKLDNELDAIYGILGDGPGDYTRTPVDNSDFAKFKATPSAVAKVTSQSERSLDDALQQGDYFHVENKNAPEYRMSSDGKKGLLERRARRIIVNVNSQKAALAVADNLTGLYRDGTVSPYIRDYKVYLTKTASSTAKKDKLVIYYRLPDDGDDDRVGSTIVRTIARSADPSAFVDDFAPFYSRVDKGIAWSEEPKYYDVKGSSFTESREIILKELIEKTGQSPSLEHFVGLVGQAFADSLVDPEKPHRHLPQPPAK